MSYPQKNIRTSFLSRKFEELLVLDAIQNFSSTMLPFFNSENFPFLAELNSSIMAGDSPTSVHKDNLYNFEGRSTPPPTTSYSIAGSRPEPLDAAKDVTTLVDPLKDDPNAKDKEKDDGEFNSPDANPGHKPETERQAEKKKDGGGGGGGGGDKKSGDKKANGSDKLDGQWVPSSDKKEDVDDDKGDNCVVNCLYYTLQCCECTIT